MFETGAPDLNCVKHETLSSDLQRCQKCKYFTKSTYSIKKHLQHEVDLEEFSCQNTVEEFFCEICNYATHFQICFKEHQEAHRNEANKDFKLNTYTCDKCSFQTFSSLFWMKHQCSVIFEDDTLNCAQCDYKASGKHPLKNHILNEHLSEKSAHLFDCDNCQFRSHLVFSLEEHIELTHRSGEFKKWFRCAQCDYKTKYSHCLKVHVWKHHRDKNRKSTWSVYVKNSVLPKQSNFSCDKCEFQSKAFSDLNKHKRSKHGEAIQLFQCDQCEYKTQRLSTLTYHEIKRHESKKWLHCDQCEFKTKRRGSLTSHINFKHLSDEDAKWYHCDQCDYKTKHEATIRAHVKSKHETGKKWFECDNCTYRAKLYVQLKSHRIHEHLFSEWFECDICDYRTRTSIDFKKHLVRQHKEWIKWHPCDQCGYIATSHSYLTRHTSRHQTVDTTKKEQRLECDQSVITSHCPQCPYSTKNPSNLKSHLNSQHLPQDSPQWFECTQCEFKTKHAHNLKEHKNEHEFKKQFKCDHCDYATSRGTILREHVLRKHTPEEGIQWFECDKCKYRAKLRRCLKVHMMKRHNEGVKWHKCDQCEYSAKEGFSLKQHVINKHRKINSV